LPNGVYELHGWVKRGNPAGGTQQAELYAYAENFGSETIINNLLETVPATAASYSANTGNATSGQYPYTEISIPNIHVTNGQVTIGFYANSPDNVSASANYAFIDDLSLALATEDPEPPKGDDGYSAAINVGRLGDSVIADFRVAAVDSASSAIAVLAAYDKDGVLNELSSAEIAFSGEKIRQETASLSSFNPDFSYVAYLWDAVAYQPIAGKETLSVKSVDQIIAFPNAADGYTLPSVVTARYNSSTRGACPLPVAWENPGPFTSIGEYTVNGVVEGTNIPAVAYVTVQGDNLLLNPTLDTWTSSSGSPASWTRSSTTSNRFSRDAGAKNQHATGSGTHYSAAYYLAGTAAGSYVSLYQTVALAPGKYMLNCYAQGLIISGSSGDITLYHSAGTTEPTGRSAPCTTLNGVGDWQYMTYVFEVAAASSISVGVRSNLNNGTWLQVDDFTLSKIG
jgi:hypothetical protein